MPVGYISSVRVQDVLTGKWFNYETVGGWDTQPIVLTPWGGVYIATWITNFSGSTQTLTVSIESEGRVFIRKTETVENGAGFGVETPGTVADPPTISSYYVKVVNATGTNYILNWEVVMGEPLAPTIECPICGTLFFTEAQLEEHLLTHQEPQPEPEPEPTPEPEPEPSPIILGPCLARMIRVPARGQIWIRTNIRAYMPKWSIKTYYGFSKAVFEIFK